MAIKLYDFVYWILGNLPFKIIASQLLVQLPARDENTNEN